MKVVKRDIFSFCAARTSLIAMFAFVCKSTHCYGERHTYQDRHLSMVCSYRFEIVSYVDSRNCSNKIVHVTVALSPSMLQLDPKHSHLRAFATAAHC